MANTRSLCLCTLLVATTLMQGCRGQCDGQVKVLVATEEAKTFEPIARFVVSSFYSPAKCEWLIKAEDGYIIYLRVPEKNLLINVLTDGWSYCPGSVSLYDGTHPERTKFITRFCMHTDQVFSTSGQNMLVFYRSGANGLYNITMEYWAAKKDERQKEVPEGTMVDCYGNTTRVSFMTLFIVGLLICSIILCCCCYCCCCRSTKCRASRPSDLTSPAPLSDTTPLSSHTHHDDQGLVAISTRGNSSTSRTVGTRANSSSAVPLLSAPQPEASNIGRRPFVDSPPAYDDLALVVIYTVGRNSSRSRPGGAHTSSSSAVPLLSAPQPEPSAMGRRSLADSPPAYDDLELVVIPTVGRNSSPSRPGGVHTSSSSAVPVTAASPLEDFSMDRRSLVDSPPAYDAVVTSNINRSEENPQETLTVRLPSYSEAVAVVNMATHRK